MIRGSSREIFEEVGWIFGFWRNIRFLRFFLLIWAKRTIDSAWLRNSRIALSECLVFYRHIPSGKKKSGWNFLFFHREKVFPKKYFFKNFRGKNQNPKISNVVGKFSSRKTLRKFHRDFFLKILKKWKTFFSMTKYCFAVFVFVLLWRLRSRA